MTRTNQYNLLERILFPSISSKEKKVDDFLTGKTILITGASYGIGEAIAKELSKYLVNLILVARTESKLLELKYTLENNNNKVYTFPCDLRNEYECNLLLSDIEKLPCTVDVFINNAGKSIRRSVWHSLDRFHDAQRTMNLNYFASVQLCLGLIPILRETKGHIINISAVNVLLSPSPYWSVYQASKVAFDQWFKSVAYELNVAGVVTTSIYLPLVRTQMIAPTKEYANAASMTSEHVAQIVLNCILKQPQNYKPWWLKPLEIISFCGGHFLNRWVLKHYNRNIDV